jgi:hypothetical protein
MLNPQLSRHQLAAACCEIGVDVAVGAIQLVNGRKLMEPYDASHIRIRFMLLKRS